MTRQFMVGDGGYVSAASSERVAVTLDVCVKLSRAYPARYGVPIIRDVSLEIFRYRYFTHCMQCGFCNDWCCQYGVDVDIHHVEAMERHREALERYTGIHHDKWFTDEVEEDDGMPGGATWRTAVVDGACVFLNRKGRGCLLHAFSRAHGIDYHEIKSVVDCLFPLTFEGETLTVADEVTDGSLVCLDTGPTIYRGLRAELEYYFGDPLVSELDCVEHVEQAGGDRQVAAG